MDIENSQKFINDVFQKKLNYEDEILDYKLMFKFDSEKEKFELIKDIVSFANTEGGFIIYGVKDKYFEWEGLDEETSDDMNDIKIKSFLNKYVPSEIFFKCGTYVIDGKTFYLITIDKLNEEPIAFSSDGHYLRTFKGGKKSEDAYVFHKGDIYGRVGSSCTKVNDDLFFFKKRQSTFKLLSNLDGKKPPYKKYVERVKEQNMLLDALSKRINCVQINGIGGIGKTSLVWNFCEQVLNKKINLNFKINSIIWLTGKMDYFSEDGEIITIRDVSLSFDEVLCEITDVLMMDVSGKTDDQILKEVYEKLETYPALFVFDNMETIRDAKIDNFFLNLPAACKCIFTTRVNMRSSYLRIDITGFDINEFDLYVLNVLEEKRPSIKDKLYENIKPHMNDFLELTCGSPIIMNFILQKICAGYSISTTLEGLRDMNVNSSNFISSVMEFCFNDTYKKLTLLQKQILYALSIPENDDEIFEVADISYIVSASEDNVENALSKINENSFCEYDGKYYSCSMLIKAFINNRVLCEEKTLNLTSIENQYDEWINKKNSFNERENQFFNKVKAFNFKKKMIVTKLTNYKFDYEKDHDFDTLIDKLEELIKQCPTYGYLYYEKATIFISHGLADDANQWFVEAIRKDPKNDYYLSEYAFYLYNHGRIKESVHFFNKALEIKPNLPNINHGLAKAYVKLYTSSKDSGIDPNIILDCFEKGYVTDCTYYSSKIKYCRNAGSHALFLSNLGRHNDALNVCDNALKLLPNDYKILSIKGNILSRLNPSRISETKINKTKSGIFSALSDEEIEKLLELVED